MTMPALLDAYTDRGDLSGFPGWCKANGWRVALRGGWWLAYDAGGRLAAAAVQHVREARRPVLSRVPCATCGALPIGEYGIGDGAEARRRYACGPHAVVTE